MKMMGFLVEEINGRDGSILRTHKSERLDTQRSTHGNGGPDRGGKSYVRTKTVRVEPESVVMGIVENMEQRNVKNPVVQ